MSPEWKIAMHLFSVLLISNERVCQGCGAPLKPEAHKTARFCSRRCRGN